MRKGMLFNDAYVWITIAVVAILVLYLVWSRVLSI